MTSARQFKGQRRRPPDGFSQAVRARKELSQNKSFWDWFRLRALLVAKLAS